jgi:RNA polymerase sigma-70 factor (ECF subfamily)
VSLSPDSPDLDDKQLLELHLSGDPNAFDQLFMRHKDRLWFVALRVTSNREDAADAVQEAMLNAYRKADTFRGDSAVSTWLHRITVNAALDRIAKRNKQPIISLDDETNVVEPTAPHDASFSQVEANVEITTALGQISEERRAVVVLVDLYGYPLADAANTLNIPVGTAKSRLFRGRGDLAKLLQHMLPNVQRGGVVDEPTG